MSGNKQIVVGGGFAGTTLVGELERRLPPGYQIVLVSEESYTTLWAIGDCAFVRNHAADGAVAPPTAQFAIAQARHLARNIVDALADGPTRAFGHVSKGMMATTGHLKGVAQAYGVSLSGLPAWLLWRAYYLSRMPTLGRKFRIWIEWTWGMFFAADITHLRFTRTNEVEREALAP